MGNVSMVLASFKDCNGVVLKIELADESIILAEYSPDEDESVCIVSEHSNSIDGFREALISLSDRVSEEHAESISELSGYIAYSSAA